MKNVPLLQQLLDWRRRGRRGEAVPEPYLHDFGALVAFSDGYFHGRGHQPEPDWAGFRAWLLDQGITTPSEGWREAVPRLAARQHRVTAEVFYELLERFDAELAPALAADRAGALEAAAAGYEAALGARGPSLLVLLNLAVLLWRAAAGEGGAGDDFAARARLRFPLLLAEAGHAFPRSAEPEFWQRHIRWVEEGAELTLETCRELLLRDLGTWLPMLQVFLLTGGREGRGHALELLARCREEGTTRARYVVSVLAPALDAAEARGRS